MTARETIDAIEEDPRHGLTLEAWATRLLSLAPAEYRDRPISRYASILLPGSAGKIEMMARRVAKGQSPCHPNDATWSAADEVGRAVSRGLNGGIIHGRLTTNDKGVA